MCREHGHPLGAHRCPSSLSSEEGGSRVSQGEFSKEIRGRADDVVPHVEETHDDIPEELKQQLNKVVHQASTALGEIVSSRGTEILSEGKAHLLVEEIAVDVVEGSGGTFDDLSDDEKEFYRMIAAEVVSETQASWDEQVEEYISEEDSNDSVSQKLADLEAEVQRLRAPVVPQDSEEEDGDSDTPPTRRPPEGEILARRLAMTAAGYRRIRQLERHTARITPRTSYLQFIINKLRDRVFKTNPRNDRKLERYSQRKEETKDAITASWNPFRDPKKADKILDQLNEQYAKASKDVRDFEGKGKGVNDLPPKYLYPSGRQSAVSDRENLAQQIALVTLRKELVSKLEKEQPGTWNEADLVDESHNTIANQIEDAYEAVESAQKVLAGNGKLSRKQVLNLTKFRSLLDANIRAAREFANAVPNADLTLLDAIEVDVEVALDDVDAILVEAQR